MYRTTNAEVGCSDWLKGENKEWIDGCIVETVETVDLVTKIFPRTDIKILFVVI
jgi:hypothetical protein